MTNPIQTTLLNFLAELSMNNDRDWFNANKKRYEQDVKAPFEAFVGEILEVARESDAHLPLDPKKCIFRLHRDTRFSKDKRPYKDHLSAVITPGGSSNKETPGFYFQIGIDEVWLGGGAYFMERPTLNSVRHFIADHPKVFTDHLTDADFVKHYATGLQGEVQKRLSPELMEAAKAQQKIFQTQFYFMSKHAPEACLAPNFTETVLQHYRASIGMNKMLISAMSYKN